MPSQKAISLLNALQESIYSQDSFARSILQSVQGQFTPEGVEEYVELAKETVSPEELSDDVGSLRKLIESGNALLPTPYEDIGTYSLMMDLATVNPHVN
ncbi:MAG: hypothetical protein HYZ49_08655 [Chloroflexi bacterium]|nr:hypothetical protein [Chloroflexota bacterium]